jgi:hypothetical protein
MLMLFPRYKLVASACTVTAAETVETCNIFEVKGTLLKCARSLDSHPYSDPHWIRIRGEILDSIRICIQQSETLYKETLKE